MKTKIYAPEMDRLLRWLDKGLSNPNGYDKKTKEKINELYELLDKIKPVGDDELTKLYFNVERGSIDHYGDYEELKEFGNVSNYEEFEKNFKEDYPDDISWYKMTTSKYKNYRMITISNKVVLYADMDEEVIFEDRNTQELLDFLIDKVKECLTLLKKDKYNDFVENNLPYKNRFGVIKRSNFWKQYPSAKQSLLSVISQEEIDNFVKYATQNTDYRLKEMTSSKYFECVRLAYQANGYDLEDLSDKELYLKYSDGRDEGLRDLNEASVSEFEKWYNDKNRFGGHPWEIMCGHSFSRINLIIRKDDNGWYLSIDGNIVLRKVEIAKMFLVFKENNVPLVIYNVDIIKNALSGNDYIGIVPREIIPIRCDGYFTNFNPKEFIHYGDYKSLKNVIWQNIDKVYLK